jgi:hypothetical protein
MQQIQTSTIIKLDLIDSIKVLLGRCIKVDIKTDIHQEQEIGHYNASANVSIEKTTTHFIKQDKPRFGWAERGELSQK